ncbi:MAG: ribokinase [Candidatus Didemnitutus sp.]|nr:ribokinase [Candidatus Didemnitutus sp.]
MDSQTHVVVVGSIMQDLTFTCVNFPIKGETTIGRLTVGQGGKGSNQAIACGRAGATTTFVGAMGRDGFADQVREYYRKEGSGCRLALKSRLATGTAVILVDRKGDNQIVIEPGANELLSPVDVPRSLLTQSKVVVVQLESNLLTTAHVLRVAHDAGVTTMLNPAPMRADFDPKMLRFVDILVPNETEFVALVRQLPHVRRPKFNESSLLRMTPAQLHNLCRKFGVPTLIITLGSRGCFVSEASGFHQIPAHRDVGVVDTTGAGDAFCGGFAAGLVRCAGRVVDAAHLGTAMAALSITKAGAASSMPTKAELRRFLSRHGHSVGYSASKSPN